jgi:DNA-binding NarL/FixJ family response regulator
MLTVAIYATDRDRLGHLEQILAAEPAVISLAGASSDDDRLAAILSHHAVKVVVADAPAEELLAGWRRRFGGNAVVVLAANIETEALELMQAGAHAVLPAAAPAAVIIAAVRAAAHGLAVLPDATLATLLTVGADEPETLVKAGEGEVPELTARELEVLAAMADGASNKVIARRLGISYHTVKFHVAAILAKLDAESRTEAVARAAHLGLVML